MFQHLETPCFYNHLSVKWKVSENLPCSYGEILQVNIWFSESTTGKERGGYGEAKGLPQTL